MVRVFVVAPEPAYAAKVEAAGGIPVPAIPEGAVPLSAATAGALVLGPLDRAGLQKAARLGASGIVLGDELLLLPESPLDAADRAALATMRTEGALPSGRRVGKGAALAAFLAKRAGSLANAFQQIQADVGAIAPAVVPRAAPAPVAPAPPTMKEPPSQAPKSAPSPPTAPVATDITTVLAKVTELVSQKTGYPPDILDPDLDMEADLGIDTVKQAELFGTLRETFSVPRDDALQLKDFPTLRKVAEYMSGKATGAPRAAMPVPGASPPAAPAPAHSPVTTPVARPAHAPPAMAAANMQFETAPPEEAVAIIGVGAVLPTSPSAPKFWENVLGKVNGIIEVPRDRWDPAIHYDPDPTKEDKTYSKIGGFITDFTFDSLKFRIPPTVAKALDPVQTMALSAAAEALADAGYATGGPGGLATRGAGKPFDRSRCAVILGNSLGGERKDETNKRMHLAEFAAELRKKGVPGSAMQAAMDDIKRTLPPITEDTMPGELSNVIAGRLANVLDLGGKNLTTDAACASSHAALDTAVKCILGGEADMVLCGGVDRSMDPGTYVKFSKIGALSAKGSTPFDARADGFVMGEGTAIFLLKRLSDAVRDGDKIYCVVRGMGSSSDGKGKGITAPNPAGQKLAIQRAFQTAQIRPEHVQLLEAHGTSTEVGDAVEIESAAGLFKGVAPGTIALGSVKSQIGHLKSAAGAAGLLKAAYAIHHKTLPPSINFQTPSPNIKWAEVPFYVNTDPKPWPKPANGEPRRAAVSSFGFGGTNFHIILEEYLPEYHGLRRNPADPARSASTSVHKRSQQDQQRSTPPMAPTIEGEVVVLGAESLDGLIAEASQARATVHQHATLARAAAAARTPRHHLKAHRVAFGATTRDEMATALETLSVMLKDAKGRQALGLKVRGAAYGEGPRWPGKIAFLFPGQGSQYANMCAELAKRYPVVRATFEEADAILQPLIGQKLTSLIFVDGKDKAALAQAEEELKRTEITQPAMLAADVAILRLLEEHGVRPDMAGGHSLGEYAALVAAGVLSFADALTAVSARGKEMANVHVPDKGLMASFSCGPEQAEEILRGVQGYVVAANKNCPVQTVIAGDTPSVKKAMELAAAKGVESMLLPVSAAFHTSIVAPASAPLRKVLERLPFHAPATPVFTNVDATLYPSDPAAIRDILAKQVAAPVEWAKEMHAMYDAGARIFIEVGPKRALAGFVDASFGKTRPDVVSLLTNHPKTGDLPTFYAALAKLAALGHELSFPATAAGNMEETKPTGPPFASAAPVPSVFASGKSGDPAGTYASFRQAVMPGVEAALQEGYRAFAAESARLKEAMAAFEKFGLVPADIVVSGAAMGLPGQSRRVFDDKNFDALFAGENRIDRLDPKWAQKFLEKEIVRLVKDAGEPRMEPVSDAKDVLKLAGRKGELDLASDYGVAAKLVHTLDITSKLAIAAAYEALFDAGIPMVREQKVATTGKILQGDWVLPAHMQDETGVVFASAFPGYDNFVQEVSKHLARRFSRRTLTELDALYHEMLDAVPAEKKSRVSAFYATHAGELQRLVGDEKELESFNRHFLFSVLSLGHAELAETIVARGPNAQVNAACSSSTLAIAIAEDWIRTGRCERVLVVGADDVTSENMLEWIGSGFLVSGAATTAASVEEGALPFDKRRHGMIIGMGAVGLVIETRESVEARGMIPVARLVATKIANSAYHGSRLDVGHIAREAKSLVETAARRLGTSPDALGAESIFVSHETYTPARGGSASAEAAAMRAAFGTSATKVLIANTKGFTGHPMGAGIEDALAVKALQFGRVPPIANLRDVDPEFADLNLSRGGAHERRFAMRFSAGFGSQLAMAFFERMARGPQRIVDAARYQSFLDQAAGAPGAKAERVGRVLRISSAPQSASGTSVPVASPPLAPARAPVVVPVTGGPASSMSPVDVLQKVVALVAEKTGYPVDMLDPDLDMEADLGIDTVKQAEIFAQLRDQFAVPREEGLTLKEYPTLAKVAGYMSSRMGASPAAPSPSFAQASPPVTAASDPRPAPSSPHAPTAPSSSEALARITDIIAKRSGYPPEMLDPTLDMEADLGIDTVKQAEIFAEVREAFGIPRVEGISLKDYPTISQVAGFVASMAGRGAQAQVAASAPVAASPPSTGLTRRVPRVVDAHAEGATKRSAFVVGKGDLAEALRHHHPHAQGHVALFVGHPKDLFLFAKKNAADLESGALGLLAITHMGGAQGIQPALIQHPEDGGVTGMTKALAAEFPKAWIRALDLDPEEDVAARLRHVDAELKVDHSRVEVGRKGERRIVVRTIAAGPTGDAVPQLPQRSVIVVTGGARGITAEILKALLNATADASPSSAQAPSVAPQRPTLILLARTPPPTEADATFDEAASRERAKAELAASGAKVTPVAIEKRVAPHRARHEVWRTLAALRAAGATVEYHAVDASDAAEVARVISPYKGKLTGIIHAAGLEESKKLADKDDAAFDRTWAPKAGGAFALAQLAEGERLQFFVMFGSVAGRYGNAAQADYSAANDAMAKLAHHLRHRGVAASVFCWGPWGETGMATKGSTLTVLSSLGVEPITTKEGVQAFLSELARLDEPEVVLAKSLGALEHASSRRAEPQSGGVETARHAGTSTPAPLRRTLDAKSPEIDHHRVNGVPYLAGVHGLALMSEASSVRVTGFSDVTFGYPVKLLRDEPVEITATVDSVGNAKLTSVPKGPLKLEKVHFTGTVLTAEHSAPPPREFRGAPCSFDRIYPPFFHGPAFQVLSRATRVALEGIEVEGRSPATLAVGPLAATAEGAFQALGLWGLLVARKMALPERVGKIVYHGRPDPARTVYRVFAARLTPDGRVAGDVECVVDGNVVMTLTHVALIVTGASPGLDGAPAVWRAEEVELGEGSIPRNSAGEDVSQHVRIVRVPVDDARGMLAHPELQGAWLSETERATLSTFPVEKRRVEWLAATLAGKTALRNAGDARPFHLMTIARGDDGAPLAHETRGITLTHAGGYAAARVFDITRERAGVDLETVEERPGPFEEEAFTADERAAFPHGAGRPAAVTLAWSAKEAVLKALGLGLSADLHDVRVRRRDGHFDIELAGRPKAKFVEWDGSRLDVAARVDGATGMALATVTLVRRGGA